MGVSKKDIPITYITNNQQKEYIMALHDFKYVIDPNRIYTLNTSDNSVVEVLGQDLITTYLTSKGYI